jgi:flagellar biosynthesis protein FlhF
MKIKRYTAASMRHALASVRDEQGPDAVILSSRQIDGGVEVIAAVDYDEELIAAASRQLAPSRDATPKSPAPEVAAPAPVVAAQSIDNSASYGEVRRELQDLRGLLEMQLASVAWNDLERRDPARARAIEALAALDIAPDVARTLTAQMPESAATDDPARVPMALLLRNLPVVNDAMFVDGGTIAIVGPTGVGKTTTIAKLAARWVMHRGASDVALVSTDGFRVGAREQLMTFARILDVPMFVAANPQELGQILGRLSNKKLILIDTAGLGQRDAKLVLQLAALTRGASLAKVLLALPAQGESHALDETVRAYSAAQPVACVLTKVDEAASLGGAFSAVLRHKLPIAYVCDGQRVPEDLHAAHNRRLWLVSAALQLQETSHCGAPTRSDTSYLARRYTAGASHV